MRTPDAEGPRLALVILAVADLASAVAFYRAAFGWTPRVEVPVYVEFDLPGAAATRVGLYQRESFALNTGVAPTPAPPGAISSTELYLRVDDLDRAVTRLREVGARELSAPAARPWGDTAAYFADPDGNVIAVSVET